MVWGLRNLHLRISAPFLLARCKGVSLELGASKPSAGEILLSRNFFSLDTKGTF